MDTHTPSQIFGHPDEMHVTSFEDTPLAQTQALAPAKSHLGTRLKLPTFA